MNIMISQQKYKAQYDRKHVVPHSFGDGQQVLRKNVKRTKTKGGKLMYHFSGPYTKTNALPGGVYQLSDAEGNVSRATGGHLKLYQTNESDDNLSAQLPPSPTEYFVQLLRILLSPLHLVKKTSEVPATKSN